MENVEENQQSPTKLVDSPSKFKDSTTRLKERCGRNVDSPLPKEVEKGREQKEEYPIEQMDEGLSPSMQSPIKFEETDNEIFLWKRLDSAVKKIKRILTYYPLIYSLLTFIIIILQLIYYINMNQQGQYQINNELKDALYEQYNKAPIQDIINQTYNSTQCPEDYEKIILYEFPGISEGCFCNNNTQNEFMDSVCSQEQLQQQNCQNVTEIPQIQMYRWNLNKFCLKRNKKYYKLNNPSDQCIDNYQRCSTYYCVSNTEVCPISDIMISDITGEPIKAEQQIYLEGYSTTKLLISREYDDFPIIDLLVSVGDMPCADITKLPTRKLNIQYKLLNTQYSGCGDNGKDYLNTFLLYKKKESEFYLENGFNITAFSLPEFNDFIGEHQAYLIAKKQMKVKNNSICMNINLQSLDQISKDFQKIKKFIGISLIFDLIFSSLFLVISLAFAFIAFRTRQLGYVNFIKVLNSIFLFTCTYYLYKCIHFTYYNQQFTHTTNYLQNVNKQQCFQYQCYNNLIRDSVENIPQAYSQVVNTVYTLFGFCALAYLVLAILYIIKWSIQFYHKKYSMYNPTSGASPGIQLKRISME